jgi:hypothetical protein
MRPLPMLPNVNLTLPVLPVAYGMRLLQQITSAAPVAFYQCVCVYEMRADRRDVSLHTTRCSVSKHQAKRSKWE